MDTMYIKLIYCEINKNQALRRGRAVAVSHYL